MATFNPLKKPSAWRKLSLVTWKKANDPTAFGQFDFNVTQTLVFLEELNRLAQKHANQQGQTLPKITMTHLLVRMAGLMLETYPAINGIIKWGRIYLRNSIDVFLQVAVPNKDTLRDNLSGAKISDANQKTVAQIAFELEHQAKKIRENKDILFSKNFQLAKMLPIFLLRFLVKIQSFLVYELGLHLPKIGLINDPFGSLMITSVGSLGIPPALAPLVPISRCPLIICVGRVEKKPIVTTNDTIVAAPILSICCTLDHRFIDGLMGSRMFKLFKEMVENPEKHLHLDKESNFTVCES